MSFHSKKCIRRKKEMKKAILATKVGMTQIFNEDGQLIPVTVLQAGPCNSKPEGWSRKNYYNS